MSNKNLRTLVIGLDGASFELMAPLLESGALPNIQKLMDSGAYGPLRSIWPPITPAAWPSFYTGKNPGKHGIYGFVGYNDQPSEMRFEPTNYNSMDERPFWDVFAAKGLRSCLINLPITYPLPKVEGVCIAGLGTPNMSSDMFSPPELRNEVFAQVPDFKLGFDDHRAENWVKWTKEKLEQESSIRDVALYLMERDDNDLFMVVFEAPDKVGHMCWQLDADPDLLNKFGLDKKCLDLAYEKMDEFIGELVAKIDLKRTNVLILSDHGFGSFKKFFYINKWLLDQGYLVLKKVTPLNFFQAYRLTWKLKKVPVILRRMKLGFLLKLLPAKFAGLSINVPMIKKHRGSGSVDWSKTRAYAENWGIFVNMVGRERTGIVNEGKESADLIKELSEKIKELKDPATGRSVVGGVFEKSAIFSGKYMRFGADVNFYMDTDYLQSHAFTFNQGLFSEKPGGTHRADGMFVASGPAFKKGQKVANAGIMDLMPTMLRASSIPVPSGVDGKVLTECFEPTWLESSPEETIDLPPRSAEEEQKQVYDDEQRQVIEGRLKNMGYL